MLLESQKCFIFHERLRHTESFNQRGSHAHDTLKKSKVIPGALVLLHIDYSLQEVHASFLMKSAVQSSYKSLARAKFLLRQQLVKAHPVRLRFSRCAFTLVT